MPWESEADRQLRAASASVQGDEPRSDTAFLEPWASFSKRWWNLNLTATGADGAATSCADLDMGFDGALGAIGMADERCAAVVPAFASANDVSVPTICTIDVADIASGLAESGVRWSPPAGAKELKDLCCRACSV